MQYKRYFFPTGTCNCNELVRFLSVLLALQNDLEEVLYSQEEGVTDLYPSNTWDSEDDMGRDDYLLTSGWM